jgi:hypothetical protein
MGHSFFPIPIDPSGARHWSGPFAPVVAELGKAFTGRWGIVYHGMESGDAEVLQEIDKGGTREQAIETAEKLRKAGSLRDRKRFNGDGSAQRRGTHHHRGAKDAFVGKTAAGRFSTPQ